MKKAALIGSLPTLLLVLSSVLVFARSGCCSGHGGVDCSAGAQGNGNVVCNDGWRGSSCEYSSMVMCGGSSSSTRSTYSPPPDPTPTVRVAPTSTPIPKPTATPVVPTPTQEPTPTLEPSNTPETKPTESIAGEVNAEVLGSKVTKEASPNLSPREWTVSLGIIGAVGYGTWKLVKKGLLKIGELFGRGK